MGQEKGGRFEAPAAPDTIGFDSSSPLQSQSVTESLEEDETPIEPIGQDSSATVWPHMTENDVPLIKGPAQNTQQDQSSGKGEDS